jgi:hypothetical protein
MVKVLFFCKCLGLRFERKSADAEWKYKVERLYGLGEAEVRLAVCGRKKWLLVFRESRTVWNIKGLMLLFPQAPRRAHRYAKAKKGGRRRRKKRATAIRHAEFQ